MLHYFGLDDCGFTLGFNRASVLKRIEKNSLGVCPVIVPEGIADQRLQIRADSGVVDLPRFQRDPIQIFQTLLLSWRQRRQRLLRILRYEVRMTRGLRDTRP